jgi:hypothetical protein
MRIIDMQERRITDSEIDRHLGDLVSVNGRGVLALVERRAKETAAVGGPLLTQNSLRLAAAARKKIGEN